MSEQDQVPEISSCVFCGCDMPGTAPQMCELCYNTEARSMYQFRDNYAPQDVSAMQAENLRTNLILFQLAVMNMQLGQINEALGEDRSSSELA